MSEEESNARGEQTQPDIDKVASVIERVVLSKSERESLTKEEWAQKWLTMESYVSQLEERLAASEGSKPVNWCFFLTPRVFYYIFVLIILQFANDKKKEIFSTIGCTI